MKDSLFTYAVRLLARRAHGRKELERKLIRKDSPAQVESVLNRLEELGYLDDTAFASMRARAQRTLKRWGNQRIQQDLIRLGVNARIIDLTLDRLEEELPEVESLVHLIRSWVKSSGRPKDVSQLKKLYDHCLRRGYSPEMVRSSLGKYFDQVDWM